jgi:hypothetical protein
MAGQAQGDGAREPEELGKDGRYVPYGTGANVLVTFSGDPSTSKGAAAWGTALCEKKLGDWGVGHVYGVGYNSKTKVPPAKLVDHFMSLVKDHPRVFVVAHSSGSWVAHAFLAQVEKLDKDILARTTYYNIDGGRNSKDHCVLVFKTPPKKVITAFVEDKTVGYGSRNPGSMEGFGFGAELRNIAFAKLPPELLPKKGKATEEQAHALMVFLHRRLIVTDATLKHDLNYETAKAGNVTLDWIKDKDKDL